MKRVLAIDVGSNTIKSLLVEKISEGSSISIKKLYEKTCERRISNGAGGLIDGAERLIIDSIREFLGDAHRICGGDFKIAAAGTSALRDAPNAKEILESVRLASGCDIRVLSGVEEARLARLGAFCDPSLSRARPLKTAFFDLGGGSIDMNLGRGGDIVDSCSLPLGAVRLTKRFIGDAATSLSSEVANEMRLDIENILGKNFSSERIAAYRQSDILIACGGAVGAARIIKASRGIPETDNAISDSEIRQMFAEVSRLNSEDRCKRFHISPARADILPAAFLVISGIMQLLNKRELLHTFYNLRWGIASEIL